MTLEWGLCRAVQEWQRVSNFDRMIYYRIAEKFMEFEAEEEVQIQKLQWMPCAQDLPPPAPPKLDPRGTPAPKVGLQPGTQVPTGDEDTACAPRMSSHRAQPSRPKSQRPPEPKAPKEIPPEAVREYMDIMEALVGPVHSATGESDAECGVDGNELKQEEDGIYSDPGLLSYIDKLCSQEDSVTKLVQKRLLTLKEDEAVWAATSHSAPGMHSSPSESDAGQSAQRHDQDPHLGVSDEACPPEIDSEAPHRLIQTDTGLCRPKVFVPSRGRQEVSSFRAGRPSPPQGQRPTDPLRGPRDASVLSEASPVQEAQGPRYGSGEDKLKLPGVVNVVGTHHRMRPFSLPQSRARASGLASHGGWGAWSAPHAPSPQRRGLSPAPPAAPKSRKQALCGRPAAAEKLPIPGAVLGVSGRPGLALGPAHPSRPRRRKRYPFVIERRKKRKKKHCSQ
ncbi:hypothetical protein BU61_5562 [Pontoporia blainvillei]|uniref:Nuclear Testis protein N-terminal domain-containing protein n=1 Tax=Pontoporia blainvillei TaxID=48723 RepID=A0ABX0RZM8_PONBL|nr:hypothetical protein [Pontoporia blainvillei]